MTESTEGTDTFRILADPTHWYVLYPLAEQKASVTFDRLTTRLAAWHIDRILMRSWNESSVSSGGVTGG